MLVWTLFLYNLFYKIEMKNNSMYLLHNSIMSDSQNTSPNTHTILTDVISCLDLNVEVVTSNIVVGGVVKCEGLNTDDQELNPDGDESDGDESDGDESDDGESDPEFIWKAKNEVCEQLKLAIWTFQDKYICNKELEGWGRDVEDMILSVARDLL